MIFSLVAWHLAQTFILFLSEKVSSFVGPTFVVKDFLMGSNYLMLRWYNLECKLIRRDEWIDPNLRRPSVSIFKLVKVQSNSTHSSWIYALKNWEKHFDVYLRWIAKFTFGRKKFVLWFEWKSSWCLYESHVQLLRRKFSCEHTNLKGLRLTA